MASGISATRLGGKAMGAARLGFSALGIAVAALTALAASAQTACPAGPEGNLCKAGNGDPMAMYMVGREAYAAGRESGDLSEALAWARRARDAGYRGGRMLLKMVYVQMGEGTHRDYVQAHVWLTKAIEAGDDYLEPWRARLEARMTGEERESAMRAAEE